MMLEITNTIRNSTSTRLGPVVSLVRLVFLSPAMKPPQEGTRNRRLGVRLTMPCRGRFVRSAGLRNRSKTGSGVVFAASAAHSFKSKGMTQLVKPFATGKVNRGHAA